MQLSHELMTACLLALHASQAIAAPKKDPLTIVQTTIVEPQVLPSKVLMSQVPTRKVPASKEYIVEKSIAKPKLVATKVVTSKVLVSQAPTRKVVASKDYIIEKSVIEPKVVSAKTLAAKVLVSEVPTRKFAASKKYLVKETIVQPKVIATTKVLASKVPVVARDVASPKETDYRVRELGDNEGYEDEVDRVLPLGPIEDYPELIEGFPELDQTEPTKTPPTPPSQQDGVAGKPTWECSYKKKVLWNRYTITGRHWNTTEKNLRSACGKSDVLTAWKYEDNVDAQGAKTFTAKFSLPIKTADRLEDNLDDIVRHFMRKFVGIPHMKCTSHRQKVPPGNKAGPPGGDLSWII